MCYAVTCKQCGKTTWAGCGQHVDGVKRGVPADQWCGGTSRPVNPSDSSLGYWVAERLGMSRVVAPDSRRPW